MEKRWRWGINIGKWRLTFETATKYRKWEIVLKKNVFKTSGLLILNFNSCGRVTLVVQCMKEVVLPWYRSNFSWLEAPKFSWPEFPDTCQVCSSATWPVKWGTDQFPIMVKSAVKLSLYPCFMIFTGGRWSTKGGICRLVPLLWFPPPLKLCWLCCQGYIPFSQTHPTWAWYSSCQTIISFQRTPVGGPVRSWSVIVCLVWCKQWAICHWSFVFFRSSTSSPHISIPATLTKASWYWCVFFPTK